LDEVAEKFARVYSRGYGVCEICTWTFEEKMGHCVAMEEVFVGQIMVQ